MVALFVAVEFAESVVAFVDSVEVVFVVFVSGFVERG